MTPQENVDQVTTILIDAIRASGMTQDELADKCDMSRGAVITFMERKLKTGGSLNSFCAMLNAVGATLKIEFSPHHPPADLLTAGVHDKPAN